MDIENVKEEKEKDSVGKLTGFFLFRTLINGYNNAKELPEEERKDIKKYGVISFILSLIATFISLSCLFFVLANYQFFGFSYVVMIILYFLGGVIISVLLAIYGFVFAVMQIRLNRKAIGIWGIVFSILAMVSSVLLIIFIFI